MNHKISLRKKYQSLYKVPSLSGNSGRTLTTYNVQNKGFIVINHCNYASREGEIAVHLFQYCPTNVIILESVCGARPNIGTLIMSWVNRFNSRILPSIGKILWQLIFHALIWDILHSRYGRFYTARSNLLTNHLVALNLQCRIK